VEGDDVGSTLIALIEFPSMETMHGFAGSDAYAPCTKARQTGDITSLQVIDDTDIAGAIPYLPKP